MEPIINKKAKQKPRLYPSQQILHVITLKQVERAWTAVPPHQKNKYLIRMSEEDDPELTVRTFSGHLRTLYVDQETMEIMTSRPPPKVLKPLTFEQTLKLYKFEKKYNFSLFSIIIKKREKCSGAVTLYWP